MMPLTQLLLHFLGAFAKLRKATISFAMSFRPSVLASTQNKSAPTRRISIKFGIWAFFENLLRKFKFHYNLTTVTGTLHEDVFAFLTISRWILLRIRNISDRILVKIRTHVLYSITFLRKSCCLWNNVEKYGASEATDYIIMRRMSFACWVRKATYFHPKVPANPYTRMHGPAGIQERAHTHTHTHTDAKKCNTELIYFPRQQLFRERTSVLRYM